MKKSSSNTVTYVMVFAIGMIIGFMGFIIYNYISSFFSYILITINAVLFVGMFYYLKTKTEERTSVFIKEVTMNIKKLATGAQAIYNHDIDSPDLTELYDSLTQIQQKSERNARIKDATLRIINTMTLSLELDTLLEKLMPKINEETKSSWSAFYIYNQSTERLQLKKSIGFSKNIYNEFDIDPGEGFSGLSLKSDQVEIINDIPDDTIYISRSFLGKIKPKSIMCIPVSYQGDFLALLLVAAVNNYEKEQLEIANMIRYHFGVALNNCNHLERVSRLKNELQFQNQLIHDLNEELEDKVMHRTRFLNSIIDAIMDYSITAVDKNNIITTWNKGSERLRGFTAEEAIGSHVSEIFSSDTTIGKVPIENKLKIAFEAGVFEETGWYARRDGRRFYTHVIIKPLYNDKNDFEGFASVTKDITDIRENEQSLIHEKYISNALFNHSAQPLIFTDIKGMVHTVNTKAEEILKKKLHDITGDSIFDYLANAELARENIQNLIETGDSMEWYDDVLCGARAVRFQIHIAAFNDANGQRDSVLIQLC